METIIRICVLRKMHFVLIMVPHLSSLEILI